MALPRRTRDCLERNGRVRGIFPQLRIVAIATDRRLELRALKAGADDALPPTATPAEVARAAAALLSR